MENHHAIEVQGLHKRFNQVQAVKGVRFNVAPGQIFSLLVPTAWAMDGFHNIAVRSWKEPHGSMERQNCR